MTAQKDAQPSRAHFNFFRPGRTPVDDRPNQGMQRTRTTAAFESHVAGRAADAVRWASFEAKGARRAGLRSPAWFGAAAPLRPVAEVTESAARSTGQGGVFVVPLYPREHGAMLGRATGRALSPCQVSRSWCGFPMAAQPPLALGDCIHRRRSAGGCGRRSVGRAAVNGRPSTAGPTMASAARATAPGQTRSACASAACACWAKMAVGAWAPPAIGSGHGRRSRFALAFAVPPAVLVAIAVSHLVAVRLGGAITAATRWLRAHTPAQTARSRACASRSGDQTTAASRPHAGARSPSPARASRRARTPQGGLQKRPFDPCCARRSVTIAGDGTKRAAAPNKEVGSEPAWSPDSSFSRSLFRFCPLRAPW